MAFCRVIHGKGLTYPFRVKTDTKQGCILSPFLFLFVIDWVTRQNMKSKGTDIQWTFRRSLEQGHREFPVGNSRELPNPKFPAGIPGNL